MNKLRIFLICMLLGNLINGCPGDDIRCLRCAGRTCLNCIQGYANNVGECIVPLTLIDNCLFYESAIKCRTCEFGYRTNSIGTCEKIAIANCLSVDSNGNCKICDKKIRVKNGKCDSEELCSIPNCSICSYFDNQETCEQCKPDYAILIDSENQTSCVVESPLTKNCHTLFYNDVTRCLLCDVNYYIQDGMCLPSFLPRIDLKYEETAEMMHAFLTIAATIITWLTVF